MISFNSYVTNEQINITATNGRLPAGCADSSWLTGNIYYFNRLYVQEEYRGQKIGNKLMSRLISIAIEEHVVNITLEVRVSNEIARNLYKKFGFREVALRKFYYGDEDAILMEKQVM